MKKSLLFLCLISTFSFAQSSQKSRNEYYEGLLPGSFSISPTQTVRFSKGNLQFKTRSYEWQFAEHQYDLIGEDPDKWGGKPLENINGWIDMFSWGQNGFYGVYPGSDEGTPSVAVEGTSPFDWGYEPITNGGSFDNMWRTLTMKEWIYLLKDRRAAKEKFSTATVCGIKGIVLLPDNWTLPTGCVFNKENASFNSDESMGGWEIESSNYSKNTYNQSQWDKMEKNGAVFLPAAADLSGFSLGWYWTSSAQQKVAEELVFDSSHVYTTYEPKYKSNGMSVRLVQNNSNVLYKSPGGFLTKLIGISESVNTISATFEYFIADEWITISPNAYLETNTGARAKLVSTKGIKIEPEKTIFKSDVMLTKYNFTLVFESLPKPVKSYDSISIIESDDSSWKWTDIIVR